MNNKRISYSTTFATKCRDYPIHMRAIPYRDTFCDKLSRSRKQIEILLMALFVLSASSHLWARGTAGGNPPVNHDGRLTDKDFDPEPPLPEIIKIAEHGDATAQSKLGLRYFEGNGVSQDYKEAAKWFRKSAYQGNADGQLYLGRIYRIGLGITKDSTEAAKWLRKAAEQGNDDAQTNLGIMYEKGNGVPQNYAEAANLYRKAAEQGNPTAQVFLGYMYAQGNGVTKDETEAAAWYRKAAEQGDVDAQAQLGARYADGTLGVTQDYVEAYRWLILAAAQGDTGASKEMARLSPRMTRDQVAEAQKLASRGPLLPEFTIDAVPSATTTGTSNQPKEQHASDVDAPTFSLKHNSNNFALVVGIEKYQKLPAAQFAERDAASMRHYLLRMGYPERNIVYLSGENATRARLSSYLDEWLPKNVNSNSTVFVYFSGHGAPSAENKQAYLMPWDGDAQFLKSTAYPLKHLYTALNHLKAKTNIVVLDSCFSGSGGRSVLAAGTRPLVSKVTVTEDLGGVVLFAAASSDEITGTLEEQGHGAFTYYLLKGLTGEATGPSGSITTNGLYRYLKPLVQDAARRQNREQTPFLGGAQQDVELIPSAREASGN